MEIEKGEDSAFISEAADRLTPFGGPVKLKKFDECLALVARNATSVSSASFSSYEDEEDSLPTRPVCTPGSLINKFFCFDSTVVLTITPRVTPIAPARQHIHSTCTGGNASIVSYPPADATIYTSSPLIV